MVAGGYDGSGPSTELLRPGASSWTAAASLPYAAWGLGSASLAGSLYISGGYSSGEYRKGECSQQPKSHCNAEILRWDDQTETWTVVGMMETGRYFHAMVAVAVTADADTFCTTQ